MKKETKNRKLEHINICTEHDIETHSKETGFNDVDFVHNALSEIDKDSVDLSVELFGKKLNYPIIISGMTGGHEISEKINKNLAIAAQELGIGMGLGSQRAMLEDKSLEYTYQIRKHAPDILLIGNLGIAELKKYSSEEIEKTAKAVNCDVFAIHLNALQEALQKEGDTKAKDSKKILADFAKDFKIPVLVKETGAGISREVANELIKMKIAGIDLGGAGGTSFAAVEIVRSKKQRYSDFWDWGIPTAASLIETRSVSKEIPVIASGGIRTGLDIAKSLALGANAAGIALPLLESAKQSSEKVVETLKEIINGLRTAMFLVEASNTKDLKSKEVVITGRLREWLESRKIKV